MPQPVLQALILAEDIHEDEGGKKVIVGVYNRLSVESFPSRFETRTWAYIALTDVYRRTELELQFRSQTENRVVMQGAGPIAVQARSPLESVQMVVPIPAFPLPHEGVYSFDVLCEGALLGSCRLTAAKSSESKE